MPSKILIIFITIIIFQSNLLADWYNTNWHYRQRIIVDHTKVVNSDLTNFPLLMTEAVVTNTFWTSVKSNGADIVVTSSNGTIKLNRELVSFDRIGKKMELWVNTPFLSTSYDTTFYLYYGNNSALETNNKDTWNSTYKLVEHLKETSGGMNSIKDSTTNTNHGTDRGSINFNDQGKISQGIGISWTNDYIVVKHNNGLNITSDLSLELWMMPQMTSLTLKGDDPGLGLICKRNSNTQQPYTLVMLNKGSLRYNAYHTGVSAWTWLDTRTNVVKLNQWQHVAMTRKQNGNQVKVIIYHNAIMQTNILATNWSASQGNTHDVWIMKEPYFNFYTTNGYFQGKIDEVRILNSALSSNWIKTEYNNQNDITNFFINLPKIKSTNTNIFSSTNPTNTLSDLGKVIIVPNPFKPNANNNAITFYNLTSDAEIKIYTITGRLVVILKESDGDGKYIWDVKDSHGKLLPAGIYMCHVTNSKGQKKYLQLVIKR